MPNLKLEFLWDEDKTRKFLRNFCILIVVGAFVGVGYALMQPEDSPYNARTILFLSSTLTGLFALVNLLIIKKPHTGLRLLISLIALELSASITMTYSGGFRSPIQFSFYGLMLMTVFWLGSQAVIIVGLFAMVCFFGIYFWQVQVLHQTQVFQDFFFYVGIFLILTFVFKNLGQELSVQLEARKKLEQVDDLKNQFISLSSHYLRTPIAVMRAFTGDLEKTGLNSQQSDDLKGINDNIEKLTQLIDKFLAISSIERGETKINTSSSDIVKLLDDLMSDFKKEADEHQVILSTRPISDSIPSFYFDSFKLKQAFSSVIDNAIRYNRPGGYVVISVKRDGNSVVIKVEDTGFGIKKDQIENMFSTFNVGGMEKVLTMDKVNVGLNLYLTKLIIDSHKGKILLESQENKGSVVTITIPMVFKEQNS